MYEPKWDGFRCLVFRDHENIFLQSKAGKSLTSGFPEINAAFQALSAKMFVLDGELAMPRENGFSFDGLVNRLRIGSARLAMEARDSPAIYIAFDMLANSENLLGSPFRLRRKALERFFESCVPRSLPLYLSASTEDLREVEKWVGHIGQQLDGIIGKRADAPYRPGDDHSIVKIILSRALEMSSCLGFTIRRSAFNTSVPSASTQSRNTRLVTSDRRRRRLSTGGSPANSHTGAEKPLDRGNPWLRPKWSRFAMIISVTSAFATGARSSECARTNLRRTAYSSKCSNRP
jgi:hypothetical protein